MSSMKFFTLATYLLSTLLLTACGSDPAKFADIDSQRLLNAAGQTYWLIFTDFI